MREITIQRACNGWVIRRGLDCFVFDTEDALLLKVYQSVCDWKVGDKVKVEKHETTT